MKKDQRIEIVLQENKELREENKKLRQNYYNLSKIVEVS
jgi:cell division septum initiation protein DivIVA